MLKLVRVVSVGCSWILTDTCTRHLPFFLMWFTSFHTYVPDQPILPLQWPHLLPQSDRGLFIPLLVGIFLGMNSCCYHCQSRYVLWLEQSKMLLHCLTSECGRMNYIWVYIAPWPDLVLFQMHWFVRGWSEIVHTFHPIMYPSLSRHLEVFIHSLAIFKKLSLKWMTGYISFEKLQFSRCYEIVPSR